LNGFESGREKRGIVARTNLLADPRGGNLAKCLSRFGGRTTDLQRGIQMKKNGDKKGES